jgi:hypothetical protein
MLRYRCGQDEDKVMDESGGHNAANDKPTEQTVVAGCKTGSRTAIQDDDDS